MIPVKITCIFCREEEFVRIDISERESVTFTGEFVIRDDRILKSACLSYDGNRTVCHRYEL